MRTNLAIAALVYPMVQAVVFGLALLGLLAFGASSDLFAPVIAATFLVSIPPALLIAPRLRSLTYKRRHGRALIPG